MDNVPYGFCQCGCGQKTNIAKQSVTERCMVKGEPIRYCKGHKPRVQVGPYYIINEETGCWEWQRSKDKDGYARKCANGKTRHASRIYYEQKYGPIPEGLVLDHFVCQNRACVNPDHLEVVTNIENVQRGLSAKLNEEEVREIRLWAKVKGVLQKEIAEAYGIGRQNVSCIINNKTWKGV